MVGRSGYRATRDRDRMASSRFSPVLADQSQVFLPIAVNYYSLFFEREDSRSRCGGNVRKRGSVFQGLWKAMCAFHHSVIFTAFQGCLRFVFGLLGLLDSVAWDIEFEDDAVVNQAIDGLPPWSLGP
jgi:hypothetical protein